MTIPVHLNKHYYSKVSVRIEIALCKKPEHGPVVVGIPDNEVCEAHSLMRAHGVRCAVQFAPCNVRKSFSMLRDDFITALEKIKESGKDFIAHECEYTESLTPQQAYRYLNYGYGNHVYTVEDGLIK